MNRDEVTELAENNAALEAEETKSTEAPETAEVQEETTEEQGAAPATEESASEAAPESAQAEASAEAASAEEGAAETAAEGEQEETAALPTRDADGFSISELDEDVERKHVENGAEYEVIFAVRSGDQLLVEESSQRVSTLIEETFDGAIDNVRVSEVRRFAYPIKKQTEGVYVVINARFQPEHTEELDRFFKFEENVLRHMVLKTG